MAKKIMTLLIAAAFQSAGAEGFDWQLQTGLAWENFTGNTQNIVINTNTTNRYSVTTPSQIQPLIAAGLGYQWDFIHQAVHLNVSSYYMGSSVTGTNAPLVNGGSFDTLNYTATGRSLALMLEPKWIWTANDWQPYALAGMGIAFNHFGAYTETPTDPNGSAVPTSTPFTSSTTTSLAYEGGLGIQYPLSTDKHSPVLAIDYRFMDWGNASLVSSTSQTNTLHFGHLQTTSINVSMTWPF